MKALDTGVLAESLIDTVLPVPGLSPAWLDEIDCRLADLDAGRKAPVAAVTVLADLRARIAGHAKPS
ncbi:MAG: hypothetical protein QE285_04105 [Aquabacterium sp.]|nr:hypothetical protein [Aquabacterium sp.]